MISVSTVKGGFYHPEHRLGDAGAQWRFSGFWFLSMLCRAEAIILQQLCFEGLMRSTVRIKNLTLLSMKPRRAMPTTFAGFVHL
eukprot:3285414-Amphidinium_carterae.1